MKASGWQGVGEGLRKRSRWKVPLERIQQRVGHFRRQLEPGVLPVEPFAKSREDISVGGSRKTLGQSCRKDWEFGELGRNAKRDGRDALLCESLWRDSSNSSGGTDQDGLEHLGVDRPEEDRVGQDGLQQLCVNSFRVSSSPLGTKPCSSSGEGLWLSQYC